MSNETRKFPGTFGWLALLLLGGSIYLGWYLTRPSTDTTGQTLVADDLEVACTGRVDSFERQIALEPEVAGKVIKVYVNENSPTNLVKKGDKILEIDPMIYKIKVDEAQLAVDGAKIEVEKAEADEAIFPMQLKAQKEGLAAARANVENAEKVVEGMVEAEKKIPSTIGKINIDAARAHVKKLGKP